MFGKFGVKRKLDGIVSKQPVANDMLDDLSNYFVSDEKSMGNPERNIQHY